METSTEEVFNENINADRVWLAYNLFEKIETEKNKIRPEIVGDQQLFSQKSYIIHASYYILYIMGELARHQGISLEIAKFDLIWNLYQNAVKTIEAVISKERKTARSKYNHSTFFRSNKTKKYFEDLEKDELEELLKLGESAS